MTIGKRHWFYTADHRDSWNSVIQLKDVKGCREKWLRTVESLDSADSPLNRVKWNRWSLSVWSRSVFPFVLRHCRQLIKSVGWEAHVWALPRRLNGQWIEVGNKGLLRGLFLLMNDAWREATASTPKNAALLCTSKVFRLKIKLFLKPIMTNLLSC